MTKSSFSFLKLCFNFIFVLFERLIDFLPSLKKNYHPWNQALIINALLSPMICIRPALLVPMLDKKVRDSYWGCASLSSASLLLPCSEFYFFLGSLLQGQQHKWLHEFPHLFKRLFPLLEPHPAVIPKLGRAVKLVLEFSQRDVMLVALLTDGWGPSFLEQGYQSLQWW